MGSVEFAKELGSELNQGAAERLHRSPDQSDRWWMGLVKFAGAAGMPWQTCEQCRLRPDYAEDTIINPSARYVDGAAGGGRPDHVLRAPGRRSRRYGHHGRPKLGPCLLYEPSDGADRGLAPTNPRLNRPMPASAALVPYPQMRIRYGKFRRAPVGARTGELFLGSQSANVFDQRIDLIF
jgi:hypothetical protein